MKELYISVDIEAAGPIPGRFSLLSVGASVVGDPKQKFYVELKPISDDYDPEAIAVAGRSLDYFEQRGIPPATAMKKFREWIKETSRNLRPIFVGFNAPFDWSFINWYFHQYGDDNPFGIGGIDIKAYFMGLTGCAWSATASSAIPARFKGSLAHTHNALDDAIEQGEMFRLMLGAAGSKG